MAADNSKTATHDSISSAEGPAWQGPPPPAIDSDTTSGLELGILQGIVPFAATLDATQRAAGVAPKVSPRFETGKSIGQMLGGLGLMVLGGIGTGGGFAISLSQIGAAIGIPVAALSVGVTITGMANAAAGWQGLLQSLSTGGSAGPPGVSAGPAAPVKPGAGPRLPARGTPERSAIEAARRKGIATKRSQELANIRSGGQGSGVWTQAELENIRQTGEFPKDVRWHHDPTVAGRPDLAADPSVVRPVRGGVQGHLDAHGGDFRNP